LAVHVYRKTKGEAYRALREALAERDKGIRPGDGRVTVGALLDAWLESAKDRKRTLLFRTAKEAAEETPAEPDWIVEGFNARECITETTGKQKSGGKMTLET
jgi:hypothetical protein